MIAEIPILVGARTTLRPYSAGFSEAEMRRIYGWSTDPDVLVLSGGTALDMTFDRFCELFEEQLPRHNSAHEQLFAVLDDQGQLIGRAGLFALGSPLASTTAELGIVLGDRPSWGRGHGREAVRLLCGFGFRSLGLATISLYTYPDNERARRAFEAVGFQAVRTVRRFSFERGTHEELYMELTPDRLVEVGGG